MLNIYRRHLKSCSHTSRHYRRCKCPLWVQGTLAGEPVRKSLDLTSWERARDKIRGWEAQGYVGEPKNTQTPISEATQAFLAELATLDRSAAMQRKYKLLLGNLQQFGERKGYRFVQELDIAALRAFRSGWRATPRPGLDAPNNEDRQLAPLTVVKQIERLRSFLKFCVQNDWIPKNPAALLKPPKFEESDAIPFEPEEVESIIDATYRFQDGHGRVGQSNSVRLRALVLLLTYSGLRISDAVKLEKSKLLGGRLFLRAMKNGTKVFLPLPPHVVEALQTCPDTNHKYFFWTGESKLSTAIGNWREALYSLFRLAEVHGGHPHKFRHTFSVELLKSGANLETVARLLGDTVKIVEKHYAGLSPSWQKSIEEQVQKTWPQQRLKRVK